MAIIKYAMDLMKRELINSRFFIIYIIGSLFLITTGAKAETTGYSHQEQTTPDTSNFDLEINSLLNEIDDQEMDDMIDDFDDEDEDFLNAADDDSWSLDASYSIKNQQLQNGVQLNESKKPIHQLSAGLIHESGFSADFSLGRSFDKTKPYKSTSLDLAYAFSARDWLDFSLDYSYTKYASDTANPLASSNHDLAVSSTVTLNQFILDVTFSKLFGGDLFESLSLTGIYNWKLGNFKITPLLSVSFSQYSIKQNRAASLPQSFLNKLNKLKKTAPDAYKEIMASIGSIDYIEDSGLSSIFLSIPIKYYLNDNFKLNLTTSYAYTPQSVLSAIKDDLLLSLGMTYTFDF